MNPKYPIYIISKGRHETRLTSKTLEQKKVPYKIVVEPNEYDLYASVIAKEKIIVAPENFSEFKQGSIPVRNFVWAYSINNNDKRHWLFDDNILNFYRLNNNRRISVDSGTIFRCIEDFTDRYENIAFSGLNYRGFAHDRSDRLPPFVFNTRIYSMTLINNDLPYRWRGKYNEDTDICLRALKDGWCTILFNAFLGAKVATMTMKGGNTDTIYNTGDRRKEFMESLINQHPDIVKATWKFNRWHHQVDYSGFKRNTPILRKDVVIQKGVNNYGMVLKKV